MDKKCTKCGLTKPIEEFYIARGKASGYQSQCKICEKEPKKIWHIANKECVSERHKKNYQKNRESILERNKIRFQNKRESILEYLKKWSKTPKGKAVKKKSSEKQREKYPEKNKARHKVNHAIDAGKLPKIKTLICHICNERQAAHYHHHKGYDVNNWLDVIPVCAICHKALDYKNGE